MAPAPKTIRSFRRDRAARLIADQREICQGIAADLETQSAALGAPGEPPDDRETRFRRLVLDLRLDQTRAALIGLEGLSGSAADAV